MKTLKEKIRDKIEKSLILKTEMKERLLADLENSDYGEILRWKEILEKGEGELIGLLDQLAPEEKEGILSEIKFVLRKNKMKYFQGRSE